MVLRIPKPAPAPEAPKPPPALTREDVQAMLAERDAMWAGKLADMHQALLAAIVASKPEPAPPRKGATITFETDHRGVITSANLIPKD